MQNITADSLRSTGTATARQRLCDLLSTPAENSEALLDVMTDRGLRDALLVVAIQTGRLDDLRSAAEFALGESVLTGRSPGGPVTVIALLAWIGGAPEYGAALADAVPESDPAYRMASLVKAIIARDLPPQAWMARMESLDLATCLRFQG